MKQNKSRKNANKRPTLTNSLSKYTEVAKFLSKNPDARARFANDPLAFLNGHALSLPKGDFVKSTMPQSTSETNTAYVAGFAVLVVVAWVAFAVAVTQLVTIYSGGGGCFLSGTPVRTRRNRNKPIEKVSIGDEVLTYNEAEGKTEYRRVTNVIRKEQSEYYVLNNQINVTGRHRFWVNQCEWKEVQSLVIGDQFCDKDFEPIEVKNIDIVNQAMPVYNLTVEQTHTYYVHDVLVHNAKPGDDDDDGHGGIFLGSSSTLV